MDLLLRLPPALRRLTLTQTSHSLFVLSQRHASTQVGASTPPFEPPASPSPKDLTSSTLNSYIHTPPPSPSNLSSARAYFTRRAPLLLYSSPTFRGIPASPYPEVAFLGRSNVGKSSLLNALFNRVHARPPAHVSKRAGRTRTINGFGISSSSSRSSTPPTTSSAATNTTTRNTGPHAPAKLQGLGPGALVVVDMPGYGGGSRAEWGVEALKFLRGRAQLRRTYVLVDAEHGPKPSDVQLLAHLRGEGVPVQVVLSKADKLLLAARGKARRSEEGVGLGLERLQAVIAEVREKVEGATGERGWLGDVLCCSAEKVVEMAGSKNRARIGVDELRWAVLTACGLEGL